MKRILTVTVVVLATLGLAGCHGHGYYLYKGHHYSHHGHGHHHGHYFGGYYGHRHGHPRRHYRRHH